VFLKSLVNRLLRRPDSRPQITVLAYRQTFLRDEYSRKVFVWLLERCGTFKRVETDEQRVLHNWGIELLENMGLIQGLNYDRIVDAMTKFPVPTEAVDSEESERASNG
jgi:hypothetical protein